MAAKCDDIYGQEFLRGLIHDVVQSIRRNFKVDWTAPHREDVKVEVGAAVKRCYAIVRPSLKTLMNF